MLDTENDTYFEKMWEYVISTVSNNMLTEISWCR